MANKTNEGLVAYALAMKGHPYWYGCFGQISTKELYKAKKKQYKKLYSWKLPKCQLGTRVFDCVGLIKGYLWSESTNANPVYNKNQDVSANGMLEKCKKKGAISSMPDVIGTLVFKPGHVGIYIGGGKVIEARGHAWGVVETRLSERGWVNWGWCPWIDYKTEKKSPAPKKDAPKKSEQKTPTTKTTKTGYKGTFPVLSMGRALKTGSRGVQVTRLQLFLNWFENYKLLADGIYGPKTRNAVMDFQKKTGLYIDGKFGKRSLAKAKAYKK